MTDVALESRVYSLNFGVEKSMRYHQRMRGFYDWLHKVIMFLIIIVGSAAFSGLPQMFAAIAAILAAFDLVWGPSHRARDHEVLFRRFSNLAINIRTSNPSERSYEKWIRERITIETDEPPMFCALEADCDNEVRRAWGKDEQMVEIGLWSRLTMYLLRHAETHFQLVNKSAA